MGPSIDTMCMAISTMRTESESRDATHSREVE